MESTQSAATAALVLVAGKTVYGWASYWWNKRTLRERYIARATEEQVEVESVRDDALLDFDATIEQPVPLVSTKHRGVFRNYLVRCGQAKFGTPLRNEANRLVIRKFLYDLCVDRGLLARHIGDHLDIATEMVFIPSRAQLTAAAIRHTELSELRLGVLRDLTGPLPSVA